MSGKYIVPQQYRSEERLVYAAQNGDHRAVEHLVIEHPPMRSIIAMLKRRVDPTSRASDDLEGSARLSILEALRTFNPARGVRFTTYAYYFIRGAMLETLYPSAERYRHNGVAARVRLVSLEEPSDVVSVRLGNEQSLLKNDSEYGIDPGYASVENAARDAEVRHFVAGLTPSQRRITTDVFLHGRTHAEIAAERGTSRPAVTRILQRIYARGEKELTHLQLAA